MVLCPLSSEGSTYLVGSHGALLMHFDLRIIGCNRDAKPDERKNRVGQPVSPACVSTYGTVSGMEIQPHVQELVGTQARNEICFEPLRPQRLARDIEVSLEQGDRPTPFAFRNQLACGLMNYLHSDAAVSRRLMSVSTMYATAIASSSANDRKQVGIPAFERGQTVFPSNSRLIPVDASANNGSQPAANIAKRYLGISADAAIRP